MSDDLGERVATVEANIKTQNGLLKSIRDEQREMRDDQRKDQRDTRAELQRLASSISFFKGAWSVVWSVVTIALAAVAAWWGTHFGGKT